MLIAKILLIFFLLSLHLLSNEQQTRDTLLTLHFRPGVYTLDSFQLKQLEAFSSSIYAVKNITGYADSVGTIKYNLQLSLLRSRKVYEALQSMKTTIEKLPEYKGEEFQQDPDLSKNRKVEILAYTLPALNDSSKEIKKHVIKVLDLDDIYFIPDKPIIAAGSIPYVHDLAGMLKKYSDAQFEIVGHVNYQSKNDTSYLKDLYKLSEERAKTIYSLLIEEGIPAGHLRYKGVGNSQPVFKDPKNDEEKKKNMRVQVMIIQDDTL